MFAEQKYTTLLDVLDNFRLEAHSTKWAKSYCADMQETYLPEKIENARSRALIHLFLKANFGIETFEEREHLVTDGPNDGGIDGYFIDTDSKTIWLIQAKFRASGKNFERKKIEYEELLKMHSVRILKGHEKAENGTKYNGKILGLIRGLRETKKISQFKKKVVLLANTKASLANLKVLSGGIDVEVYDHSRCYNELCLPILSGISNFPREIEFPLDLRNKTESAHAGYNANIDGLTIEVIILFLPAIEIARMISVYQNAILKYNPRNYLQMEGGPINEAVKQAIISGNSEEFAILNNGLTILAEDISISDTVGEKDTAKMYLSNPQIINGGQTAFTLGLLYNDENIPNSFLQTAEVVAKIIKVPHSTENSLIVKRSALIEKISSATNSQTAVTGSDKLSKLPELAEFQLKIFETSGLLLEKKKGEFESARKAGYLKSNIILERTLFIRFYWLVKKDFRKALARKVFTEKNIKLVSLNDQIDIQSIGNMLECVECRVLCFGDGSLWCCLR